MLYKLTEQLLDALFTAKGQIRVGTGVGSGQWQAVGSDTQVLTADSTQPSGVKWAAASAGAMTLISSNVLGSPAANFTFSSIPGSYNHLRLMVVARSALNAAADNFAVQVNADSNTNYGQIGVSNTGSTVASDGALNLTSWHAQVTDLAAATSNASNASTLIIDLPYYANTTFQKVGTWWSGWISGFDLTGHDVRHTIGWRATPAAVTSIKVFNIGTVNFVTGSAAYLYGIT